MKRLSILISCMVFGFMVSTMYITSAKALDINVPADYSTIQEGIDAAIDGDVVIVGLGTYVENINYLGKAITLKSTDPNDPDVVAATIIDGNQVGNVVTFDNGEDPDSLLSGVTVRNGGTGKGSGGISCSGSSPTITRCVISNNSGSGIACSESSPTITHCNILNNVARWHGGGIRCYLSSPIIINCAIIGNSAPGNGGGIFWEGFAGIVAYEYFVICKLSITNSVIAQNSANYGGGCAFLGYNMLRPPVPPFPKARFTNCTIADNIASSEGGGIYNPCTSLPILINCIFWGDSPNEIYVQKEKFSRLLAKRLIVQKTPLYPKISYSNVQGRYFGIGNINADPLFVDPEAGDYRLQPDSPCIERGKRRCDMGAYGTYEGRMPWSRSGRYLRK